MHFLRNLISLYICVCAKRLNPAETVVQNATYSIEVVCYVLNSYNYYDLIIPRIQAVYGLWYSDGYMDPSEYQIPYTASILGLWFDQQIYHDRLLPINTTMNIRQFLNQALCFKNTLQKSKCFNNQNENSTSISTTYTSQVLTNMG